MKVHLEINTHTRRSSVDTCAKSTSSQNGCGVATNMVRILQEEPWGLTTLVAIDRGS